MIAVMTHPTDLIGLWHNAYEGHLLHGVSRAGKVFLAGTLAFDASQRESLYHPALEQEKHEHRGQAAHNG
jgi:hypothetical protein